MKKIYYSLLFFFAATLFSPVEAIEQWRQDQRDTTLLSEWIDGDYKVCRYLVRDATAEPQFIFDYSISASTLSTLNAADDAELKSVDAILQRLRSDTLAHVRHIVITGYASPDGNAASNELLALERAQKFRSLLDSRYGLSPMYTVRVEADVESWQACDAAIRSSSLGDKQQVLDILDSSASESAKEQQLKRLPSAWSVLRSQILPSMRRVDMKIFYDVDAVVEVRTLIEKPRPKPTTVAQRPNRPPFKDDMSLGVIVDMNHEDGLY